MFDVVNSVTSLSTRVFGKVLDAIDYVYSLVCAKMNTAKLNCLLAVQMSMDGRWTSHCRFKTTSMLLF